MEKPSRRAKARGSIRTRMPDQIRFDQAPSGGAQGGADGPQAQERQQAFPTFWRQKPRKKAAAGHLSSSEIRLASPPREPAGLLALQLALQGFDLFGERGILGNQSLDLAHGMQHGRMIAPAEAASDFGQRAKREGFGQVHGHLART